MSQELTGLNPSVKRVITSSCLQRDLSKRSGSAVHCQLGSLRSRAQPTSLPATQKTRRLARSSQTRVFINCSTIVPTPLGKACRQRTNFRSDCLTFGTKSNRTLAAARQIRPWTLWFAPGNEIESSPRRRVAAQLLRISTQAEVSGRQSRRAVQRVGDISLERWKGPTPGGSKHAVSGRELIQLVRASCRPPLGELV